MSNARLILNARYFHVAHTGERLGTYAFSAESAAALVNYIATRETVILNTDAGFETAHETVRQHTAVERFMEAAPDLMKSREYKAYRENPTAANASRLITRATNYTFGVSNTGSSRHDLPATRAQRARVADFARHVPALKQTMEYMDYIASPTRENASEVLSHALEVGMESAVDSETLKIMMNYIAERPSVERDGEAHGLFTSTGVADLLSAKEAVSTHGGNVFSLVFSLHRDDANRLGYDRQDAWRGLFTAKQDLIARAAGVSLSSLHWCAAVHNTKHHPHAHFIFYSDEKPFLNVQNIEHIKQAFVSEIFRDERMHLWQPREEIKQELQAQVEALLSKLADSTVPLQVTVQLRQLSRSLADTPGRKVYKYLPQAVKEQVDAVLDAVSDMPCVKELIDVYNVYQQQLIAFYSGTEEAPKKLSEVRANSHLYALKNLVVRAAADMSALPTKEPPVIEPEEMPPPPVYKSDRHFIPDAAQVGSDNHDEYETLREKALTGKVEDKFRFAQFCRYNSRPDEAILWMGIAADNGHAEACYHMNSMYRMPAYKDMPLADEYLLRSKILFEDLLREGGNRDLFSHLSQSKNFEEAIDLFPPDRTPPRKEARAAYFLGRIYLSGIEISELPDINQKLLPDLQVAADPFLAAAYLETAHTFGYGHAAYYLGKIHYRGDLGEVDFPRAAEWYAKSAENDTYCAYSLARMLQRDQGVKIDYSAAQSLFLRCANQKSIVQAAASYEAAEMQRMGQVPCKPEEMQALYAIAAKIWIAEKPENRDSYTSLRLAHMFERGLGVQQSDSEALRYYAETEQTPDVLYKTASLLSRVGAPPELVCAHYAAALTGMLEQEQVEPSGWRELLIGTMYQYGKGTPQSKLEAAQWYQRALENGEQRAAEKLASLNRPSRTAPEHSALSGAQRLLRLIGDFFGRQVQQSPDIQPGQGVGRVQRLRQKRHKRALGQKSDYEQSIN